MAEQQQSILNCTVQFSNGKLIGDDETYEETVESVDDSNVDNNGSAAAASSSSSAAAAATTASGHKAEVGFSEYVPEPPSKIWSAMPQGMVSDVLDQGTLIMDDVVLRGRMEAFRVLITSFIARLVTFIQAEGAFLPRCNWKQVPVTFFVAGFLLNVDQAFLVDIVCSAVLPQAQYILMDPSFLPAMLLELPRISKKDYRGAEKPSLASKMDRRQTGSSKVGFRPISARLLTLTFTG